MLGMLAIEAMPHFTHIMKVTQTVLTSLRRVFDANSVPELTDDRLAPDRSLPDLHSTCTMKGEMQHTFRNSAVTRHKIGTRYKAFLAHRSTYQFQSNTLVIVPLPRDCRMLLDPFLA